MLRLPRLLPASLLLGLMLVLTGGVVPAQQPLPQLPPPGMQPVGQPEQADPNAPEVLARGPVHEAFATTSEAPVAAPVVGKQPPDPIEELPPDQKPEGDNVQWISGYWHWDDDGEQYIWISGFWRNTPPGRLWLPGSWREVRGGWQWVAGFWQEAAPPEQPQQVQPELQYLPQPPDTVEVGPAVPAPTTTSFYVPGSWTWRGRYLWRPGFWIEHRPNWVWVPAHFRWTPLGYVFVDGYWDYSLAERGVLFAPVYFPQPIYTQPAFVYTPAYVVSEPCMVGALFVRRGWGNYFFGDYFAPRYSNIGFNAWCGTFGPRGGFAIGFGTGRTWGYDPLWSYYSVAHQNNPGWFTGVGRLYGGRYRGDIARPPVNLVQQNTVINNITNVNVRNVTNNVTVVNKNVRVNNTNVTDVAMLAPVSVAKDLQPEARVRPINAQVRKAEAANAMQTRAIGAQRNKLETANAAKQPGKGAEPRTVKLDVPKTVAARSVVRDAKQAPPANPNRDLKAATKVDPRAAELKDEPSPVFNPATNPRIDPKVNPKIDPSLDPKFEPKGKGKVDPKGKLDPKIDPKGKIDPKTDPKLNPKGKLDPKGKFDPKTDPKVDPKGKFDPKIDPKMDPKGKFDPKTDPKVDPKGKLDPKFDPKVDPKGKIDPFPKLDPKTDPKGKIDPKTDPMPKGKFDPMPKVDPKGKTEPPPVFFPKGKGQPKLDPKGVDPKSKGGPPTPTLPKGKIDPPPTTLPKSKVEPPPTTLPKGKFDPKGKGEPPPRGKGDPKDPKEKTDPKEKKDPPPPGGSALRFRPPPASPTPLPRVGPSVNNPTPARQPVFTPPATNNPRTLTLPKSNPATRPLTTTPPSFNLRSRSQPGDPEVSIPPPQT
ncbi:MAG TPA: hypothetical protein VM529_05375, partial [Gemmata sp.]|nr:hypothetical protein [Gemmata sp.]